MSTLRTNTLQNAAGSKSVPVDTVVDGTAKAWVNFNGTGTVAIRASGNVSSITDGGTGTYTVNFTTAMPDANYASATAASAVAGSATRSLYRVNGGSTTTSCRFDNASASAMEDPAEASVAIFR